MEENFEKLECWQRAKELCRLCYEIAKGFPQYEKYAMGDQIRRASVSVPANIAEGYSRRTAKDINHFMDISIGSMFELITIMSIAHDMGYVGADKYLQFRKLSNETIKLINGFKRYNNGQ